MSPWEVKEPFHFKSAFSVILHQFYSLVKDLSNESIFLSGQVQQWRWEFFKCSSSRAFFCEKKTLWLHWLSWPLRFSSSHRWLYDLNPGFDCKSVVWCKHNGCAIQTGAAFIQPTHCVLFLSNYRTIPCRTQWSTNRNLTPLSVVHCPFSLERERERERKRERGRVQSCWWAGCVPECRMSIFSSLKIIFHSTNCPCCPPLKEDLWEERNAGIAYPPSIHYQLYRFSFMMTWRDMGAYQTPPSWIIDNWEILMVLLSNGSALFT